MTIGMQETRKMLFKLGAEPWFQAINEDARNKRVLVTLNTKLPPRVMMSLTHEIGDVKVVYFYKSTLRNYVSSTNK